MSTTSGQGDIVTGGNSGFPKDSNAPGEQFEPRQTATSEDYEPDPSKSIKLSPQRQALVDDVSRSFVALFETAAPSRSHRCIISRIRSGTNDVPDHRPLLLPAHRPTREAIHPGLCLRRPIRIRQRPIQNGRPMVRSTKTLQRQH